MEAPSPKPFTGSVSSFNINWFFEGDRAVPLDRWEQGAWYNDIFVDKPHEVRCNKYNGFRELFGIVKLSRPTTPLFFFDYRPDQVQSEQATS